MTQKTVLISGALKVLHLVLSANYSMKFRIEKVLIVNRAVRIARHGVLVTDLNKATYFPSAAKNDTDVVYRVGAAWVLVQI